MEADVLTASQHQMGANATKVCQLSSYLLSLVFLLLFKEVGEVDQLLHGLHLPAQVLQVHATGPAVGLQQQAEPLAHRLVVHL